MNLSSSPAKNSSLVNIFFKCGKDSTFVWCFNNLESNRHLILISIYFKTFYKFWKIQTML